MTGKQTKNLQEELSYRCFLEEKIARIDIMKLELLMQNKKKIPVYSFDMILAQLDKVGQHYVICLYCEYFGTVKGRSMHVISICT